MNMECAMSKYATHGTKVTVDPQQMPVTDITLSKYLSLASPVNQVALYEPVTGSTHHSFQRSLILSWRNKQRNPNHGTSQDNLEPLKTSKKGQKTGVGWE